VVVAELEGAVAELVATNQAAEDRTRTDMAKDNPTGMSMMLKALGINLDPDMIAKMAGSH